MASVVVVVDGALQRNIKGNVRAWPATRRRALTRNVDGGCGESRRGQRRKGKRRAEERRRADEVGG
jgi:hypothetical protein